MPDLKFPEHIQNKLISLSKELGKNIDDLIQEVVLEYLEDLEDLKVAEERLAHLPDHYIDIAAVEKSLDLTD